MSTLSSHSFEFQPTAQKIEALLKFYQNLDKLQTAAEISLAVTKEYHDINVGYANMERNCWLTLRFAVERMSAAYHAGKSQVQVKLVFPEGMT